MWELLPHLAGKEQVGTIVIEQREDQKLRSADARTVSRLRDSGALSSETTVKQLPASSRPALWLADAAAAAWRRHLVEDKQNWSRWYAPHTTLVKVPYRAQTSAEPGSRLSEGSRLHF
jgi:hypothetical protein